MHGGAEFVAAVEAGEFDEYGDAGDCAAELGDQVAAGFHGSAGGQEVVYDQYALAFDDGVGVHFEGVFAVLEVVGHGDAAVGELAGLADDDEAGGETAGDGGAEDESAAFGADDEVDVLAAEGVGEELDGEGEAGGVGEEGCDVAEEDAGLGEIGYVANQPVEIFGHGESLGKWAGFASFEAVTTIMIVLPVSRSSHLVSR